MTGQEIIALAIAGAAALYVGQRIWRTLHRSRCGGTSCGGCAQPANGGKKRQLVSLSPLNTQAPSRVVTDNPPAPSDDPRR